MLSFRSTDRPGTWPRIRSSGSFGQLVTSTLMKGGLPLKKLAYLQIVGRNITGIEADQFGIVSMVSPADELEEMTTGIACEIASRHQTCAISYRQTSAAGGARTRNSKR